MKISEAARQSGLPAKTIRYYESIGLFNSERQQNGYRDYQERDVKQLRFINRARQLGFSLDECRGLLQLFRDPHRASRHVKELAESRMHLIDEQIANLMAMKETLSGLITQCPGNDESDCIILDELADEKH
ncbi:Cu(I)-responsive transcriptional regulator [Gynuella sp.]|uniref:Cu(I)-responsive transcriptional regulator n=1 Tax=Gynuella sp. TaxID=2969146 RepID=UPI003D102E6D